MTLYVPSPTELEEMCRVAEFARVIPLAHGNRPKLIIKARTHTLQQIRAGCALRFITTRIRKYLAYAVCIYDQELPLQAWSLLESSSEHDALKRLIEDGSLFDLCLFNERELNIASTAAVLLPRVALHKSALIAQQYAHSDQSRSFATEVARDFEQYDRGWSNKKRITACDILLKEDWIENSFSVNTPSGILSLEPATHDPGRHFEQLLSLLPAHDHSHRTYHSPEVRFNSGKRRELCDALIVGNNLALVIQAKALSVTHEGEIADKPRLIKRAMGNIKKAVNQVIGAAKALADQETVLDSNGMEIYTPRGAFILGLIVISDLDLLESATEYGGAFLQAVFDKHKLVLQIIDSVEFRRLISFREVYSADERHDWLLAALVSRWERAQLVDSPRFTIILDN